MINEHDYEQLVIKHFEQIGYSYKNSDEILKIRKDLGTVILYENLERAIKRINDVDSFELSNIIGEVKRADDINLINANQKATRFMVDGVKVKGEKDDITRTYKLIDFDNIENNEFIVTNQLKVISSHQNYDNQIPDVVIYINGLPISVIELKSPAIDDISRSIDDAYKQIQNYQGYMSSLFTWNIINVISNKHINRYGSLTSSFARYSNWRNLSSNVDDINDEYFFKNLFESQNVLNILKNFTFFTSGDEKSKIIAGYHQVQGIEEASKSIFTAMEEKTGKAGIFWHTQGSGKTLSMVFLTRNINNVKRNLTTLIITDRKDLDNQLSSTFVSASDFLGQEVKQIESITDLKNTLDNRKQNGIYLCTVQKFNETIGELSRRDDILVISDEAHRSHKNINGKLEVIEEELKVEQKYGYAYYLRQAFPNATFMGFTGTPIETEDHQTKSIFGDYATKYLMSDAEADGFVVPIKYESRHAKLQIASEKKAELDALYKEVRDDVLENTDLKADVQKHLNSKIQKMDMIIGDPDRISEIASDFVKHYKSRQSLLKGKAMFVAYNRDIAFKYYYKIIELDPELKKNIRIILTANNQKDTPEMLSLIGNDKYRKDSADAFKNPESEFKIVIVVDMWLTGFDAPCLDTLYLDKPIKMHNLMQTIARVNRTYTDKENKELIKESGLVVDYIGLWKKLQEALEFYTLGGEEILVTGPEDIDELKTTILDAVNDIYTNDLLDEIEFESSKFNDKDYLFKQIEKIQRIVIHNKEKQLFVNKVKKIAKIFPALISVCSLEEKLKIQLLMTARSMLIKRELGNLDIDMKIENLKKIISDSIIHNKTIINDSIDGEDVSLTKIINYIKLIEKDIAKDDLEIEKATRILFGGISKLKNINMVREEVLTNKLQLLLDKYDSNHITAEEFVEGLKLLGHEVQQVYDEYEASDKDKVELAFYEILLDDQYAKSKYDKEMIEKISIGIFEKVKPFLTKRWLFNETVKQKVRAIMKIELLKNGYPPDATPELREKLMNQLQLQIQSGICELKEG